MNVAITLGFLGACAFSVAAAVVGVAPWIVLTGWAAAMLVLSLLQWWDDR